MDWLALVLLILLSLSGFVLNFFTGFGTLIILIGEVLYALMTDFSVLSLKTLLVLGLLYAFGEAFEFLASMIGTQRMGGSNKSAVGGVAGGLIGAALGALAFGIGALPGMLLGLFFGAALVEMAVKKDWQQAVKAGLGSLLGRMASVVVKTVIAVIMIGIAAVRIAG